MGIANYGDVYYPVSIAIKRSDGTAVNPSSINGKLYFMSRIDGGIEQIGSDFEPTNQGEQAGFYYYPIFLVGLSYGDYVILISATVLGRDTIYTENFKYQNQAEDMWSYDPSNTPQKSTGGYLDNLNKVRG